MFLHRCGDSRKICKLLRYLKTAWLFLLLYAFIEGFESTFERLSRVIYFRDFYVHYFVFRSTTISVIILFSWNIFKNRNGIICKCQCIEQKNKIFSPFLFSPSSHIDRVSYLYSPILLSRRTFEMGQTAYNVTRTPELHKL